MHSHRPGNVVPKIRDAILLESPDRVFWAGPKQQTNKQKIPNKKPRTDTVSTISQGSGWMSLCT